MTQTDIQASRRIDLGPVPGDRPPILKETDRRLDRITAETQREIATLSKQVRATEGLLTGQWAA